MTWTSKKIDAGILRSDDLYSALTGRSDHIMANYRPVLGGVSPLSGKDTTSGSDEEIATILISPASCDMELRILYACSAGGSGTIKVVYDGTTYTQAGLNATSPTVATIACGTATGSVEKAIVYHSAQAGTFYVFGGYFTPTTTSADPLDSLPPDPASLASGYPITASQIRRMKAAPPALLDARRAALSWGGGYNIRTRSALVGAPPQIVISDSFKITPYDIDPQFRLSFLASSSTAGTIYGDGGASASATSSSATTIYTTSAISSAELLSVQFTGPVQSWIVYED